MLIVKTQIEELVFTKRDGASTVNQSFSTDKIVLTYVNVDLERYYNVYDKMRSRLNVYV